MSVHFDVSKISFFELDDWSVAVCAWRGCCIEVFARAEHSVADCLRALEQAGFNLSNEAHHPGAVARLRALDDCLVRHTFSGHEKTARNRIAAWLKFCEARTLLAHGEIKATPQGITIRHITFYGRAEKQLPIKAMSRTEMLETLAEMEQAQRLLHHQLGQIRAMALKAKKPDPGSSPG